MADHKRDESEEYPMVDTSKGTARTVLESLIVITVLLTCSILVGLIFSKRHLRKNIHMLLVSNLAMAGLIFGLLVRPGTIHEEIRSYELGYGYCVFYLILLKAEWIVVPYGLWMLSIERCIAINQPQNYTKRFSTQARIAILSFPWILGGILAIVVNVALSGEMITRYSTYGDDPYFDEYTHFQRVGCFVLYQGGMFKVAQNIWIIFGLIIPFLGLCVTSIVLLITFCKKHKQKDSSVDDDSDPHVHAGSIVFSLVLNLAFALVLTEELYFVETVHLATFLYTHWFVCLGELMIGILGLSLLSETRQSLARLCGCGGGGEEEQALLEITRQSSEPQGPK